MTAEMIGASFMNGPGSAKHLAEMLYAYRNITFGFKRNFERWNWNVAIHYGTMIIEDAAPSPDDVFLVAVLGVSAEAYHSPCFDYWELFPTSWIEAQYSSEADRAAVKQDSIELAKLVNGIIDQFQRLKDERGDPLDGLATPSAAVPVPLELMLSLGGDNG